MKKVFSFIVLYWATLFTHAQNCVNVSYKNYAQSETGVMTFCSEGSNTLIVNHYLLHGQDLLSAILFTPQGLEVKSVEASWKKTIPPVADIPDEKITEYQGMPVKFATFEDSRHIVKVWFTQQIPFTNSQYYWAFLADLGKTIEKQYSGWFPAILQIKEKESGNVLYQHTLLGKASPPIKPELLRSTRQ